MVQYLLVLLLILFLASYLVSMTSVSHPDLLRQALSPPNTPSSSSCPSKISKEKIMRRPSSPSSSASPSSPSHSATTRSESLEFRQTMSDAALLLKTATFAAEKHRNQRRKNSEASPYINHPLAVANILSTYGVTRVETLLAAILHDTVEDTDTTLEEISREFGEEVASIVEECTDPPDTPVQIRKQLQIETAPHKSREAQQVKLADKMHNLRSIRDDPPVGWTPRRCQEYFIWARKVTTSCYQALPLIEIAFNDLYENQHFVMNGQIYKCHPDVGTDVVSEGEMVELKQLMSVQKKRKRDGTASPIYY